MKKGLITIILVIILSSIAYAQYSSSNPWHPLVQISGDNGISSVDANDDGIIDKANASQSCDADGVCEVQTLKSSGNIEIANNSYFYVAGTGTTLRIGDDDDLIFNGNQMYLQQSTGYLGIGTGTPKSALSVEGDIKVSKGGISTEGFKINDIEYSSIPADLWIGNSNGVLQSCDSSGSCTNHGYKGDKIVSMAVFNGKLWTGHWDGDLQSCDSSGTCTNHGAKGGRILSMAVFNNKLWIGHYPSLLQSCDSSGTCTNHGDKGGGISSMTVFNGKLWIGPSGGVLQSCDSSGTCTDHGDKGEDIYSMTVFNGKLWIAQDDGVLQSCNSSGTCTDHGDKGNRVYSTTVFNKKLWLGHAAGNLSSCDSSGTCTDHGDKGEDIYSMTVFNSKLWIAQWGGVLQSCNPSGTCTDHGDKGDHIGAMTIYNPASLGNAIYVKSGKVGIGTTTPTQKLHIEGNVTVTGSYYGDGSQLTGISGGIWENISGTATYDGDVNVTGNLSIGTGTVFIDGTNNKIGIGTTAPSHELNVIGDINVTGDLYVSNESVYIGNKALSNNAGSLEWGGENISTGTIQTTIVTGSCAYPGASVATCPAGYTVISGGLQYCSGSGCPGGVASAFVSHFYASGNSWVAAINGCYTQARAVCMRIA